MDNFFTIQAIGFQNKTQKNRKAYNELMVNINTHGGRFPKTDTPPTFRGTARVIQNLGFQLLRINSLRRSKPKDRAWNIVQS